MKALKIALLSSTFLFGTASAASAADIHSGGGSYKDAPAEYAPAFSWTGFYLGGHVGYGWADHDISSDDGGFDETPGGIGYDTDGIIGGGQIGYNWQTGNFVIGLEAEGGYLGVEGDKFAVDDPDNFADTEFGAYGVLAARLGIASERALFT
ncbi:MAG: hypothetical protein HC850_11810 [Rhodomicrobium sp.]|nr:hypothetical protein [Rhodomicrobium sp.]